MRATSPSADGSTGGTPGGTNAAVAAASCPDCQTVAIALEGVLVYGDPRGFAPREGLRPTPQPRCYPSVASRP